jgi:hypothetical protein
MRTPALRRRRLQPPGRDAHASLRRWAASARAGGLRAGSRRLQPPGRDAHACGASAGGDALQPPGVPHLERGLVAGRAGVDYVGRVAPGTIRRAFPHGAYG